MRCTETLVKGIGKLYRQGWPVLLTTKENVMTRVYDMVDDSMRVDVGVSIMMVSKMIFIDLRKAYDASTGGHASTATGFWDMLQVALQVASGKER